MTLTDVFSLTLGWTRPQSNGEHITHYNIDIGSSVIPTEGPDTYFHVESLKPDTIYSIRVQAVNSVGCGAFSSNSRLSTRPLPPAPPRCECVNANHNSLKLKWGDSKVNIVKNVYKLLIMSSKKLSKKVKNCLPYHIVNVSMQITTLSNLNGVIQRYFFSLPFPFCP